MTDRLARDAAVIVLVAAVAITAFLGGSGWAQSPVTPTPYGIDAPLMQASPLSVTTADPRTPVWVVLTPVDWQTPTPRATSKPWPTDTPTVECKEGLATPNALCVVLPPVPTARVATLIPPCREVATPLPVGTVCIWSE